MTGDLGWEDRMSQRAHARMHAEQARQERIREAEEDAEEARQKAAERARFEAGPPGGCRECWAWPDGDTWPLRRDWWHVAELLDEEFTCRHACHGDEPYRVEAFAAG